MIRRTGATGLLLVTALGLSGCAENGMIDFDLRDNMGMAFDTSPAVARVAARPTPDNRGIISYPGYQVAVTQRSETINDVAARLGLNGAELSRFNGIPQDVVLRKGEIVALPNRVAEPSPATGAPVTGPILPPAAPITTTSLEDRATAAINRGETAPTPVAQPATRAPAPANTGIEPVRHKISRGETAFSIARRYGVPVQALADWNGLDGQMTVREGAFLLIPPVTAVPAAQTTRPGQGSVAPVPPSSTQPLPDEEATQEPPKETPPSPALEAETTTASRSDSAFSYPVQGSVIRAYAPGKNQGIDIAAAAGTPVKAAASGTVAAITRDTDQVPILVVRHPNNLLTVYAGVDGITVSKGDSVKRGQTIAEVRAGSPAALHFEVREGFEAVDPADYLD
ncbi:Murein hydrolase activator NlpD precursor [Rhodobacteraceae bacterium THAF1]|uniref:peptidoglycan DD-metalloendopeptidase family protein n=1 Tax=Palleronia sp. THAF1 TaxID=2587842 RepID=UPI000F3D8431|nr:M23 family metallopeptidase [Palleronia sp. THAF1]QFU09371.1 Murein hydrolase activator NlpD precursor [Palleronia sp. THAF1]VDC22043.1 Murein hydrolase activator NlpD precursor [Rhodobacteraceae bacterium THAF1]